MSDLTRALPEAADVTAPDGLEVRILAAGLRGSMAEFRLAPGLVGRAVRHRTVEEIWYFTQGTGEMWREGVQDNQPVSVVAGTSVTVPVGQSFQVRNIGEEMLCAIAVTMPPWPVEREEADVVQGYWAPTV